MITIINKRKNGYIQIERQVHDMLLTELLERQKNNGTVAIKYGNRVISYQEWYDESNRLSFVLNENSHKDSLNIGVFLPNSIGYAVAYYAILFNEKIAVPIDVRSKPLEILSLAQYCEMDVVLTTIQYRELLENSFLKYGHKITLIFIEDYSSKVVNNEKDYIKKTKYIVPHGDENDVAIMLHTSGTTNNPKRVMLTHRNLITNVEANIESLQLSMNDKVLICMPMAFGYCNTAQFLTHLYLGASMVISEGIFVPRIFFQIVQEEKITNFTGVPSMLLMLLEYGDSSKYDMTSLRYICFGGGKMPVELLNKLVKKFRAVGFVQTYGQTEASPRITALLPKDAIRKIGSVGLPLPNIKLKVVDENGSTLASNKIGEIIIQGSGVMKGYYKQPKITASTIIDGWLHTGDLGYVDEEGYLYLTGRMKNVIISGGMNIYPEEIEEILMAHSNIREVCVVPEESKILGEVPVAKIVEVNDGDRINYRAFCIDKLANYKIPVRFDIVDALDKTYNGKIKRSGRK